MGGSIQKSSVISAKFANYSVSTAFGVSGSGGFSDYSTSNAGPALFNHPTDITTDGENFYVADALNNRIRMIAANGHVSTLPNLSLNYPSGITTDGKKLYIVNSGYNTILVYDLTSNLVVATIGSPLGLSGYVDSTDPTLVLFNHPIGITTDGYHLFVTDYGNATIRSIKINGFAVLTHAGTPLQPGNADGVQTNARFNGVGYITTDGTNLYVSDVYNRTIRKIGIQDATVTTIAGNPAGAVSVLDGIGTEALFYQPKGITTDGSSLFITEFYIVNSKYRYFIRKINLNNLSEPTYKVTTLVDSTTDSTAPLGLTTDGTSLSVCDTKSNTIFRVK